MGENVNGEMEEKKYEKIQGKLVGGFWRLSECGTYRLFDAEAFWNMPEPNIKVIVKRLNEPDMKNMAEAFLEFMKDKYK